jgi:hypothetical protein
VILIRSFARLPEEPAPDVSANFEKRYRELRREWSELRSEFQRLSAQFSDD